MENWYYVGHYGQLGPLHRDEIEELVRSGAIVRDTLVWKEGMAQWAPAGSVPELQANFPAPPLVGEPLSPPPVFTAPTYPPPATMPVGVGPAYPVRQMGKSRVLGGVLQLLLSGVGRMYLGYVGLGVAQLLVAIFTCGVGGLWSFVDGIVILAGSVKVDGDGRPLSD